MSPNIGLLNQKVEFTSEGMKNLIDLCDFLPEESRENAVIGLLYSIGWF